VSHSSEILPTIGWREWVSIPELGISGIKAKTDTGARSSCLHTHNFEVYTCEESGIDRVRFHLHPLVKKKSLELTCDWPVHSMRAVKSSNGINEIRPFILVPLKIGDIEWSVELSLSNREGMKFRMLIGRTALREKFLVNPAKSYLLGPSLSKSYGKKPASV